MHPDVPEEQAYFDRALDLRERLEANLDRAAALAADPKTATDLRRRVGALGVVDPGQAVAFGRIDSDGNTWYIGRGAIWDEDNDLLVVNWQAPVAAPFYTATPDDPCGIDARRIFRCKDNCILDIDEMVFNGVAQAVEEDEAPPTPVVTDELLESLGRERSGALADIVATIQAAQYDVIARDAEQLLVVQGGPGTGKTVVGLHRVSWLLFNRRDRLAANDVLIVGPNPAFLRYISAVLPALGEGAVAQLPLASLGPRVRVERVDSPAVRALKGERRMLRLLLRGLRNRQRIRRGVVELTVLGRSVQIDGAGLTARAQRVVGHPHNEARRALRAFVIEEVQRQLRERGDRSAATELPLRGEAARDIDNYMDRVWPNFTPQSFLIELFSTRQQLDAAAAGLLSPGEVELLVLPRDATVTDWTWTQDDIPLLDLADVLLNGPPTTYDHIVVDEAQDLSPMQFESVRRRSRTGWMTVLGDLAQATTPWAPSSWEEVALHLRRDRVPAEIAELNLGYRLPSEVHEVAMRLLPSIAPGLQAPDAVRSTGHPVRVARTTAADLADEVVQEVRSLPSTGLVGVITSADDHEAVTKALDSEGLSWAPELRTAASPITVLRADEVKGLEFDNVVVVEPTHIVEESPQGLRALFVAMTRPTNRLVIVHAEPLPEHLGMDGPISAPEYVAEPEPEPEAQLDRVFMLDPEPESDPEPELAPVNTNGKGIDLRDPFSRLDRDVAKAIAGKLAETLNRYAAPELVPMVIEEMADILHPEPDE